MNKKTRFLLFLFFLVLYLVVAPILVIYSLGYKLDWRNWEIVSTGGMDLAIWPIGATILVDNRPAKTTNFLFNEVFLHDLNPKFYNISVSKDGYFDWQKKLQVKDREVTRVNNITLIKKQIPFFSIKDNVSDFIVSPDNKKIVLEISKNDSGSFELMDLKSKQTVQSLTVASKTNEISWAEDSQNFLIQNQSQVIIPLISGIGIKNINKDGMSNVSLDPRSNIDIFYLKNNNLYNSSNYDQIKKTYLPTIKGVISYKIYQNQIYWLSDAGTLNISNLAGKMTAGLSENNFPIKSGDNYIIFISSDIIFLRNNWTLFIFNDSSKSFEEIQNPVRDFRLSPNKTKILYYNDHEISYSFVSNLKEKILVYKTSGRIIDCFWLNDYYVVLNAAGKIKISEIDIRDKTNVVEIPRQIIMPDKTAVETTDPKIYFNNYTKKLYILNKKILYESEKLAP